MSWLRTYIVACCGAAVVVFAALALLVSFVDLGMSLLGIVAMFAGALLTLAVGMLLMGLLFASARGGRDAAVHAGLDREHDGRRTDAVRPAAE
jgi:hypothetical protein